ncbi:hypothetical protein [Stenotrophomonas sp.]|uniref:hypothetical protein n=1 Tax=Stenotrophomonas sp. TaxID=69392 RepID=UPI0028ADC22F|nr:hypothetical protein [Stenotrophomonas sp.]
MNNIHPQEPGRRHRAGISMTVLTILASALVSGSAFSAPSYIEDDVATRAYMLDAGVSFEEARSRLRVQAELDPHIVRLRTQYAERIAFLSIEAHPDQHLRIGLKGAAVEPDQVITVDGTPVRVQFESGQPYTGQEFSQVLAKAAPVIYTLIPDVTGISGQPERRAIEIHIQGFDTDVYEPAVKELEAMTRLKIEFRPGMSRSRNL